MSRSVLSLGSTFSSTLMRLESTDRTDTLPYEGARFNEWPRLCIIGELKDSERLILKAAQLVGGPGLVWSLGRPAGIVGRMHWAVVERRSLLDLRPIDNEDGGPR